MTSGEYEFVGAFDAINVANENEEDRDALSSLLRCELRVGHGGPFKYERPAGAGTGESVDSDGTDSSDLDPAEDSDDASSPSASAASTAAQGGAGGDSAAAVGDSESQPEPENGGWTRVLSSNGKFYFFHATSGQSQWSKPAEYDESADLEAEDAVRRGDLDLSVWREASDEDGDPYYYHAGTRETRWTAPRGWLVWKQTHGGGGGEGGAEGT